jgi:excisionase family DNA binding protein
MTIRLESNATEWLTVSQAAALTDPPISVSTLVRWENEGKLSAVKTLGGHRRFKRADIEAQLGRGRTAENSGDDSVSLAPNDVRVQKQKRLDRPAASTQQAS